MFTIDKIKSKSNHCLTIKATVATQPLIDEEKGYRQREKSRENEPFTSFRIRPSKSFSLLQTLAATGKLFFDNQETRLAADFFSRLKLKYLIDQREDDLISITPIVYDANIEWLIHSCDLVLSGTPQVVIKGKILRVLDEEISSNELVDKLFTMNEYEKWKKENEYPVGFKRCPQKKEIEPLPALFLTDKTGAFANLFMNYEGTYRPFAGSSVEALFEKDLIECGFQQKQVSSSRYYCQVNKALAAIDFLLDLGWQVFDFQKRELKRLSKATFEVRDEERLIIDGHVDFGDHVVSALDAIQALKQNSPYIPLQGNQVGLIFKENSFLKPLQELLSEIEIISGKATLKKNRIGLISTLSQNDQNTLPEIAINPSLFQGTLRAYQQKGVDWIHFLYKNRLGGILADDMGLGKTVQVIAFLSLIHEGRHLIVVPTSLLFNWQREIARFLPNTRLSIYHGNSRALDPLASIIVTSYALLRQEIALFDAIHFTSIILDEAQAIKNRDTKITEAVLRLQGDFKLSLTGTPIENRLSELSCQFQFLQPDLVSPEEFMGDSLHLVKKKIKPFILRRKKEEVAADLPEKIEQTIFVEMLPEQKMIYDRTLATFKAGLLKKIALDGVKSHAIEILEVILRLRQICCHPLLVPQLIPEGISAQSSKFDAVIEDIETLIEEGKKIILFSQFTSVLTLFSKEATKRGWISETLDGSTKDRERVVDRFQNDPALQLFLISLKAGGVGLNLTKADYVLLYDPWWNEAVERQAIDRAHRIGRTETLIAKRYVAKGTIEENILELQGRKRSLHDAIFDDAQSLSALTIEELEQLLI